MARPTSLEITRDLTLHQDWPAPRPRQVPGWVRLALPVAVLTLLVGGIRALGGFDIRSGHYTEIGPGQPVVLGEVLELTPYRALATPKADHYQVTIEATCRNVSSEPVPGDNLGERSLVVANPLDRKSAKQVRFDGTLPNPGLRARTCFVKGTLPIETEFSGSLALQVEPVERTDAALVQTGDEVWLRTWAPGWTYLLPLTVVPRD